ncbi:MAG TPA: sulfatase [Polyangia bacterium]
MNKFVERNLGWLILLACGCQAAAAADPPPAPAKVKPAESAGPPKAETLREAMDLLNNRVHASSQREGHLVIDAGSPDFLKYVDGGWKTSWLLDEKDQGNPAALVVGLSAQLYVPIDTDGDGDGGTALGASALAFTVRSLAPKQRVSIFVNEKSVGNVDIETKTKRYQVAVPAPLLKVGENRVRFTFRSASGSGGHRSAAAFTNLTFGPAGGEPPEPTAATVRNVALGGAKRPAITIPGKSSRLSYYLQIPDGASLALSHGAEAAGAHALIRVSVDGQKPRVLLDVASEMKWNDVVLPLGAAAGQAARVDLISHGGSVAWAAPRLVVKAPPPAKPPADVPAADHIFIWMVDTLRADKVHVFNPKTRVETPNYDAFAADATRFAWAQVPGTWSLPSHASLLTGVYPPVHKATSAESKLSKSVAFIAEDMKKKGFKTAMFSSNGYVSSKWGFDRGWDAYRNFIRENLPNGADYLWKTAKTWVLQNKKKPEFAYLATVDPHVAYTPKAQFLKKYWDKPYKGPLKPALTGIQLGSIGAGKLKINDNDKAYLEALHDGEITQSDNSFATFISDLKAADLYDRSIVVVVSDHGDEFEEHGRFGHGQSVYQELTHVPLIIRAPGHMPQGKVVRTDVEIMDLYATLLDLAGVTPGEKIQGTSLVPLSWDEVGQGPRAAFTIDGQIARGLKVARYRLVAASGRLELYDELDDPREQKDIASDHPIALRQMRGVLGLLHAYETRWTKSRWGTAANVSADFGKDVGYE